MAIDALSNALASQAPRGPDAADRLTSAKEKGDGAGIDKAAREFEAYFVREMLTSMRASAKVLGDGLLDSSASDTWTEQLDAQVAENISRGEGLGLAAMIRDSVNGVRGKAEYGALSRSLRVEAPSVDGGRRAGWSWPLQDQGAISSEFGSRRDPMSGDHRHHSGLDVAAPEGTPILAAASGRVTHAGPMGSYGQLVEINHGDGIVTRYAHQSAISVAVGQEIAAGEPVGAVGSTGKSTGPHLHLEVRRDGVAVDPLDFLGGASD